MTATDNQVSHQRPLRHGATTAFLDRQAGLRTVERLDLALFVDREHQRLVRRIEVEADDILHLLDEPLVVRQLESLHTVRLEFVRLPDALHAGVAEVSWRAPSCGCSSGCLPPASRAGSYARPARSSRRSAAACVPVACASRRSPARPSARKRSCQRQTVNLLLPTDRAVAITPTRSADSNTIRLRQTSFCGVFRAEIQPSSVARSAADSQMHAEVLFMPPESHAAGVLGNCRSPATGQRPLGSCCAGQPAACTTQGAGAGRCCWRTARSARPIRPSGSRSAAARQRATQRTSRTDRGTRAAVAT